MMLVMPTNSGPARRLRRSVFDVIPEVEMETPVERRKVQRWRSYEPGNKSQNRDEERDARRDILKRLFN